MERPAKRSPRVAKEWNVPYTATIVPFPDGATFASLTESLRSVMNVSTIDTVSRFLASGSLINHSDSSEAQIVGLTVHAIWTAGGPVIALRCHPRWAIASPTSRTFTLGCFEAKATTDAGGDPRM